MKDLRYYACNKGQFEVVQKAKALIENGADPNESDDQGCTPLHHASRNGSKKIVKLLLKHGANVNAKLNTTFKTPLHEAVNHGHLNIVKILIWYGADLSCKTRNQTTPILIAAVEGHAEIVKYLIEKGAQIIDVVTEPNMSPLQLAARNRHFEVVKVLTDHGAHLNLKDIGAAIESGRLEIVEYLIQKGVQINDSNICVAIEFGHTDIVKFLVENGANVNAKDYVYLTPLLRALKNGHIKIAKLLIENGADPNTKDLYQMSALDIAIERKYYEIAKPLIEHGASVQNIKIPSEFLNIVIAVKIGHVKLVKHVLSQNEVNKDDLQRSLMIAIKNENLDIVKLLLKQDAIDSNYSIIWHCFEPEMAPIHLATRCGNEKIVKCLLRHGANVNQIQCIEYKIAPIHQVVKTGNTELAKLLLKNGANLNLQQNNGDTALHLAIQNQNSEMVNTFLTHGIPNWKLKGCSGQTSLELAKSLDYKETIKIIVQKMIEDSEKRKQDNLQPKKKKIKLEDCIICCCQRDAIYVMYPCGHAKTCETCCLKILNSSDTQPVCPVCREKAENYAKVFY